MANAGNILEIDDYLFKHPDALDRFENVRREVTGRPAKVIQLRPKFPPDLFKDQNVLTND